LSYCHFHGTIESQIGLLTRLDQLWLHGNQLFGSVPVDLSTLLVATSINLFANNLTGSLDTVFCQQPSVVLSKVDADCGGVDPQLESVRVAQPVVMFYLAIVQESRRRYA
jgi:hypothetical protein